MTITCNHLPQQSVHLNNNTVTVYIHLVHLPLARGLAIVHPYNLNTAHAQELW